MGHEDTVRFKTESTECWQNYAWEHELFWEQWHEYDNHTGINIVYFSVY